MDIPFKHSISFRVLWPHTPVCRSSVFFIPAESAERSEGNSHREAAWPHTPTPLRLQLEDRDEMRTGCGGPLGFSVARAWARLSLPYSPWALRALSLIHSISTLWTLDTKSWCFWRIRSNYRLMQGPHVRAGRSFPPGPLLQSFPSLCHWPPPVDPRHMQHTQAARTDSLGMHIQVP